MRYIICCILFSWLCAGFLQAQPLHPYFFSHLGSREGLAGDDVVGVQQDQKGFIWIATMNGLQRYDGHRFLTFRHIANDPRSIPNDRVSKIQLDRKNRLWLLCGENRVGYLDVSDFSFHEVPVRMEKELLQRAAAGLHMDNQGNIMLSVMRIAVLTYQETAGEFATKYTPFILPEGWTPNWLHQDKMNRYWICTDSGLIKYNPANRLYSYRGHNAEQDPVISAYADLRYVSLGQADRKGRFWITSWHPYGPGPFLLSYHPASHIKQEWDTSLKLTQGYHEIHNIMEQDDSTIWITGLNLFASLAPQASRFEFVPNNLPGEFTIRYDRVTQLFQDHEKNIWVSSDKGLFRFNPSAQLFRIVANRRPQSDKIYTTDVTDILPTKDGRLLVTTWGDGSFLYDTDFNPVDASLIRSGQQAGEGLTWCAYQRQNGDTWRGGQDGQVFITTTNGATTRINSPIFERGTVRQVIEDKSGTIWLGSHRGHLVRWNDRENKPELVHKFSTIYRLYMDRRGDLWVCTGGHGVYRINPATGAILAHYTSNGPEGRRLNGFGAADITQFNDSLYIIAAEGLNILNAQTGRIRYFTSDQGLPSNSVNNLITDRRGFLWITAANRLCRLELQRSILSTFSEEDGLPASGFNIASANLLPDGRIAIGRSHDLIVFDPRNIQPEQIPLPSVEITGFALMNQWLPVDSLMRLPEVRLKYDQNSVIIEFSTLTYLNQFAISYMMEGLDETWIYGGGNRRAVYNYLPPGNYTFKVRSENGQTVKIATLAISIRTPFWKSWWFYSILALVLAALLYRDDRVRMRRKAALQKMRSDIAGNLHEEVNTALNNINVLSEIARIKADKEPEQSKSYINEIRLKSHNMIIAMGDMLWSIDPANDSMARTIARIKEFADSLRSRYDIVINLQTDENVEQLKPDMKIRHEVMIIYKLALRLLVEEMKAPETNIQLVYIRSQLQLNIFSRHSRLPDSNNQAIKTIEEMKTRAASIEAALDLHSDEKGTVITLAVKA